MTQRFGGRVRVPKNVLAREVDGEIVLMSLALDQYFGLDAVGSEMWNALRSAPSIQHAYDELVAIFEVDGETLARDLERFVGELSDRGLIELING
jgi:hypothetical protein